MNTHTFTYTQHNTMCLFITNTHHAQPGKQAALARWQQKGIVKEYTVNVPELTGGIYSLISCCIVVTQEVETTSMSSMYFQFSTAQLAF